MFQPWQLLQPQQEFSIEKYRNRLWLDQVEVCEDALLYISRRPKILCNLINHAMRIKLLELDMIEHSWFFPPWPMYHLGNPYQQRDLLHLFFPLLEHLYEELHFDHFLNHQSFFEELRLWVGLLIPFMLKINYNNV